MCAWCGGGELADLMLSGAFEERAEHADPHVPETTSALRIGIFATPSKKYAVPMAPVPQVMSLPGTPSETNDAPMAPLEQVMNP
jgi:hypothetical protein